MEVATDFLCYSRVSHALLREVSIVNNKKALPYHEKSKYYC